MGLVDGEIYAVAVNETIFLAYIEKLSMCMGGEPFYLFMDQLRIHKMLTVRQKMAEYGITPIMNSSASPEQNAIETCFAQVKLRYKKKRLQALVHRREFNTEEGITDALEVITPELVKACVERSIHYIHNTVV